MGNPILLWGALLALAQREVWTASTVGSVR